MAEGLAQAKPGDAHVDAAPVPTFRERKAQELRDERGDEAPPPTDVETRRERTPSPDAGSAEDQLQDDPVGLADDEYEEQQGELFDDPDGTLDDDSDPDDSPEGHNWEKRYGDLRAEYTRMTQEREGVTAEHAEAMGETLRLRFDLEDRMQEAVGRAEYMANVMSGNANQFRNINWSQVPAEQLPQLQAQAQQAFALEQQAGAAWQETQGRAAEVRDQVKQREAAIAKVRLQRTIPNWGNEAYGQLREFAVSQGMPVQQFNDTTDPVVIEGLHALMTLRGASNNVQLSNKRKAQVPRGRNGAQKPRDSRGKFAKAQITPNQRGSFAEKTRHRLAAERQGR